VSASHALLVQVLLATASLAGTFVYSAYLRRRARSDTAGRRPWEAFRELACLSALVDLPVEKAWWVMPFLPQPRGSTVDALSAPEVAVRACGLVFVAFGVFRYAQYLRMNLPVTRQNYAAPSRLIEEGIYSRMRHPGAVGSFCIVGGLCLVTAATWTSLLYPIFLGIVHRVARIEERLVLEPRFGDAYTAYARRVPRYLRGWSAVGAIVLGSAITWTALAGAHAAVRAPGHAPLGVQVSLGAAGRSVRGCASRSLPGVAPRDAPAR
jgi:protein-S-isoprenylcysteine O-methyltransferase Ste14